MKSKNNTQKRKPYFGKIVFFVLLMMVAVFASGCSGSDTVKKTFGNSKSLGGGAFVGQMGLAEPSVDYVIEDSNHASGRDRGYDYVDDIEYEEMGNAKMAIARETMHSEPMPPIPPYPDTEGEMVLNRKVIKTASLSVEVQDYEAAAIKVINLAQKYSGFVADSNSYTDRNGKKRGYVNIRIPSLHFDAALIETGSFGDVKSQTITGDDVTENYMDLTARLNNSRREEGRMIEILEKAENINDVLRIERELSRVRGDVERSEGRLRYMDNHVSYSTMRVELYEPTPVVKDSGLYRAFKDAVNLALGTIRFLIRALGFLLPLIILGTIATIIILWRLRRGKRRK